MITIYDVIERGLSVLLHVKIVCYAGVNIIISADYRIILGSPAAENQFPHQGYLFFTYIAMKDFNITHVLSSEAIGSLLLGIASSGKLIHFVSNFRLVCK